MVRIYLDNAATSWPKPPEVYAAVDHYLRELGAPAGRGSYAMAAQIDHRLQQTRRQLATLIGAGHARHIVFTYSGTDALNLAINGVLKPGDHVVTTDGEHNSVLRPLRDLVEREQIQLTRIGCDPLGFVNAEEVLAAVREDTRLVSVTHASNVTGAVQPVEPICAGLRNHPALTLIDAAQTVGRIPIDVQRWGCDLCAAPGHKGLLAPTGTGFLYVRPGLEDQLTPLRLGGTGTSSESDRPPLDMPDRYEAGNPNVPGLLGLAAGLDYIVQRGVTAIHEHEMTLARHIWAQLDELPHVTLYGPPADHAERVAIISLNVADFDAHEVALVLDQSGPIQVRAGFHCAPRMHQSLKTDTMGGAVRLSLGAFNTDRDLPPLIDALQSLAGG